MLIRTSHILIEIVAALLAGLVLIVLAVVYIPLPHSVMSALEVRAYEADRVYVDVPGELLGPQIRAALQAMTPSGGRGKQ